jgi:hypothetical protein
VIVQGPAGTGARFGGAVALQDGDADVLPRLVERRRQERAGREEEAEVATELFVDAAEQPAADRNGEPPRDAAQPREPLCRPRFATWSRSASKITRGLRLRTYSTSAPTSRA